jgi:lipoate-protein ligase A
VSDWYLLDSGPCDWDLNMALDEVLLGSMPELGHPVLRFYGWRQPAASFGYFQKYAEIETLTPLRPLVRRPTGGGLVSHEADWTYSFSIPTSDPWYDLTARESYHRVHLWLQAAFGRLGFEAELAAQARRAGPGQCFVGHEQSDLLLNGLKIAGAAQRRTRQCLLIQGSVQPKPLAIARSREDWQRAMQATSCWAEAIDWTRLPNESTLVEKAQALAQEKYSQPWHNQRR